MESQESCWFWRKKIQRLLSEASEYQDLHTRLNFIASLGPRSLSICISTSEGIWSNAPSDKVDDDVDVDGDETTRGRSHESELAHDRLDSDTHSFLRNTIAVVFYGFERKRKRSSSGFRNWFFLVYFPFKAGRLFSARGRDSTRERVYENMLTQWVFNRRHVDDADVWPNCFSLS